MYSNVKLISKKDTELKIDKIDSFDYAKELIQSIITADEFFKAAKSTPILFAKRDDEYIATTVFGIESGKNLLVDEDGKWLATEYIPAYIRRYPFIFVKENDLLALGVDTACKAVNEESGAALFNEDGENSEYLNRVMSFMDSYQKSSQKTSAFVKELDDLELLEDAQANITRDGKSFSFTGFKKVNEEKLNSLDEETLLKLVKNGSYKLITAHLISLSNFEKLVALENK